MIMDMSSAAESRWYDNPRLGGSPNAGTSHQNAGSAGASNANNGGLVDTSDMGAFYSLENAGHRRYGYGYGPHGKLRYHHRLLCFQIVGGEATLFRVYAVRHGQLFRAETFAMPHLPYKCEKSLAKNKPIWPKERRAQSERNRTRRDGENRNIAILFGNKFTTYESHSDSRHSAIYYFGQKFDGNERNATHEKSHRATTNEPSTQRTKQKQLANVVI